MRSEHFSSISELESKVLNNTLNVQECVNYISSYSSNILNSIRKSIVFDDIDNREFHSLLINCYSSFGDFSEKTSVEETVSEQNIRVLLENIWFKRELNTLGQMPTTLNREIIHKFYIEHPSCHHKLFDYMQDKADKDAVVFFLQSDAIMNMEFFDYLVLTILGTRDDIKEEIIKNMWDEAGRGHEEKFHTTLFQRLLKEFNITYNREKLINSMGWEALAGLNLFYFLIYNPQNKIRLFGAMAATELLDPSNYTKFIKGVIRIFGNKYDLSYYSEHEEIDIIHADGWINKVILNTLYNPKALNNFKNKENFIEHFWQGFTLRLNSANLYYDYVLKIVSKKEKSI